MKASFSNSFIDADREDVAFLATNRNVAMNTLMSRL